MYKTFANNDKPVQHVDFLTTQQYCSKCFSLQGVCEFIL